jgi:hypothetical protein
MCYRRVHLVLTTPRRIIHTQYKRAKLEKQGRSSKIVGAHGGVSRILERGDQVNFLYNQFGTAKRSIALLSCYKRTHYDTTEQQPTHAHARARMHTHTYTHTLTHTHVNNIECLA